MEQGHDLAQMLGAGSRVVLMRGHGCADGDRVVMRLVHSGAKTPPVSAR